MSIHFLRLIDIQKKQQQLVFIKKKPNCMKANKNLASLYEQDYFQDRAGNDIKRKQSFDSEKDFIERFASVDGTVSDVGCSTGEVLQHIRMERKKIRYRNISICC